MPAVAFVAAASTAIADAAPAVAFSRAGARGRTRGATDLALVHDREHRGGDEDRGVGADRDPDEHREGEVLQRVPAEQEQRQDRQEHDERGVHRAHHGLVQRQVDHARVAEASGQRRGLGVLLDLVVDHDGVVQREPEDRQDRDHRLRRDLAPDERVDARRDHHVVHQRDHAADRHRPLEAPRDVDRDEHQHEQQSAERLSGDLLAPGRPDVLHVDVLRRHARLIGELLDEVLVVGQVGERVGPDRHLVATGNELDLAGEAEVVQDRLDLIGRHGGRGRVDDLRAADEVDREVEPAQDHADQRQDDAGSPRT